MHPQLYKVFKTLSISLVIALILFASQAGFGQNKPTGIINMVFSSDAHYGITRKAFRGDTNVNAHVVNMAMITQINKLPKTLLPADGGVGEGKKIETVDYFVQTGDIANRMEVPIQSAAASWAQFGKDYFEGVKLTNGQNGLIKFLVVPGNHDISNALGWTHELRPKTDPTALLEIYNMMMKPAVPKTKATYNYEKDKVNYTVNIGGIHCMFITLWPDSAERIWMEQDLKKVDKATPVMIFCHDQPTCEAKHFTNPIPPFNMTPENKFENLAQEHYKEGNVAVKEVTATDIEQRGWVAFLKRYPNIKAYFHGNSNYNEFYTYTGPYNDVALATFRVDSPMKGKYSANDETRLSFQLISLDPAKMILTVRECLWNTDPANADAPIIFGTSKTISLR